MQLKRTSQNQPLAAMKATNTNGATQENNNNNSNKKKKILFILGATATGKTKISINLAAHFGAEIINSDKIQVYKGLNIASNKATEDERKGIPHHLLAFVDMPDADFTIQDFRDHVHKAMDQIFDNRGIPIVVGGSNSYIEALVEDPSYNFKENFDICFLWMDVALPILYKYVGERVDQMCEAGLLHELREMFDPDRTDFTRGIWRTIGVPETAKYFLAEVNNADEETKKVLLQEAIEEMKENTFKLVNSQLKKIDRLINVLGWKVHRIDATSVFKKRGADAEEEWKKVVLNPSLAIVGEFLGRDENVGGVENAFSCSTAPAS